MSWLQQAKLWLIETVHLAKDALHIYVALGLFFGSMALFKWRLGDWRPLVVVLAAALAGEAWDIRDRVVGQIAQDYWGNWHDIWNTMFWPSVISLLARYTNMLRSGPDGFQ